MSDGLRAGDEGYGPTCPRCGGDKTLQAHVCMACRSRQRLGTPFYDGTGIYGDDTVYGVGRRESIITFRERTSGRVLTRHCVGRNVPAQIADGLCQLPDGTWDVQSRSTPASILSDLRRTA